MKKELDNFKKSIDLKDKENEIKKNNETKNKIKMYEDLGTPTKIPQSVKKRDNKVRTFAPKDSKIDSSIKDFEIISLPKSNKKLNRLKSLNEEYQNIMEEKYIPNPNKISNIGKDGFIDLPTPEKLNLNYIEKIMKNSKFYEYELNISDSRIIYLDKIIKKIQKCKLKK